MAIIIIEGKIGAGKTYYSLYSLLKKYYIFDEVLDEYVPKKNFLLVSNIKGLRLPHIDLKVEIDSKGVNGVFTSDYVNSLRKEHGVKTLIFIIDEVQRILDRKFYDKEVFEFFQLSRHEGLDIYLITQDVESIAKEIRNLPEYHIRAYPRSKSSSRAFLYSKIIDGEVFKRMLAKVDKRVFKIYKSFSYEESEPPKPIFLKYLVFIVVFIVLAVFLFRFVFLRQWGAAALKNKNITTATVKSNFSKPVEFRDLKTYSTISSPLYVPPSKQQEKPVVTSFEKPCGHVIVLTSFGEKVRDTIVNCSSSLTSSQSSLLQSK